LTLVLQELRAVNDHSGRGFEIFFWRTKSGLEVDFVLYGERGLIAIEVKRSPRLDSSDLRGLREFKTIIRRRGALSSTAERRASTLMTLSQSLWRRH
jgi:predicted AAA+ superfamily ATPase